MKRYVIRIGNEYVKWANILSVEGVVSINKIECTPYLIQARVYNEVDKEEDLLAWESFLNMKHADGFTGFAYEEIEFVMKDQLKPGDW
ncbi:hypothetical protein ACFVS2_20785 [Brevibacillus sp. NPDC058079]|uniref:hypothetical protein n=1 Tax=Brevibacillus sp. NPDC058079 TaxID=3346330 RepID=UPI0036E09F91